MGIHDTPAKAQRISMRLWSLRHPLSSGERQDPHRDVPPESTTLQPSGQRGFVASASRVIGTVQTIWVVYSEESAHLNKRLQARRLSFAHMSSPLRRVTLLVFLQLGVVALLLGVQGLPQPLFYLVDATHYGQIPLAAFVIVEGSLLIGCSLVLYSVRLIRARSRFVVLALVSFALGAPPAEQLLETFSTSLWPRPDYFLVLFAWLQIGLIAFLWLRELGYIVSRNWTPDRSSAAHGPSAGFAGRAFRGTISLIFVYSGLAAASVAAYNSLGTATGYSFVYVQLLMLFNLVVGVLYWLGTDAIDWGTTFAERFAHGAAMLSSRLARGTDASARRQVALVLVAAVAAIVVLIDVAYRYASIPPGTPWVGLPVFWRYVLIGGLVAGIALCSWVARIDHAWPMAVPRWALLGGIAVTEMGQKAPGL